MVIAFVVVWRGHKETEQEIIDRCKKELALFKVHKKSMLMGALLKTPTGKILKRDMRASNKDLVYPGQVTESTFTFSVQKYPLKLSRIVCKLLTGGFFIEYISPKFYRFNSRYFSGGTSVGSFRSQ